MKSHRRSHLSALSASVAFALAFGLFTIPDGHAARKKKAPLKSSAERKPSKGGKLSRPDAPDEPMRASKSDRTGELAIRRVGIAVFSENGTPPSGFSPQAAAQLCEQIASDMTLKSYFPGECLKQKVGVGAPERAIADLASKRGVDGIVSGRFEGGELKMTVHSGKTGRAIATPKAPAGKSLQVEALSDAVVGAIAEAVPYRGLITRAGDTLEINLGTRHGIQPGTMLKIFEFTGPQPTLSSPRTPVGVLLVTDSKDGVSTAKIFSGNGPFDVNAKVDLKDVEPPKDAATERVARDGMWFTLGTEVTNIDTKTDPRFNDRKYMMKSTPFFQAGMGGRKWFSQVWYGRASNEEESVSYVSALAAFEMSSWGSIRSGFTLSGGFWLSQFAATTKNANPDVRLIDSVRYSPFMELRYQYQPSTYFRFFASTEAYYPIVNSGQASAMIPFSYGLGFTPGLRVRITDGLALEGGARFQIVALPSSGNVGADERQTGFFFRALIVL